MMNNLFSMFDPSTFIFCGGWAIMVVPMSLLTMKQMKKESKTKKSTKSVLSFMEKEMKQLMGKNVKKSSLSVMTMLFLSVVVLNVVAIMPFNLTTTAHMSLSMTVALTAWVSIMFWGWMKSFNHMMTHLTPMGTPSALMNFMVLIEMVSNMIRPITLSVRLSANMVAGHLLLSLLSNFSMSSTSNTITSMTPMMMLASLELSVAVVQAYVITTLLTLYQNESMK